MNKKEILNLYKNLLRYSNNLKLTDKDYYLKRVRKEFQQNRELNDPEKVLFSFKVFLTIAFKNVKCYFMCVYSFPLYKFYNIYFFQRGEALLKNQKVI